MKCIGLDQSECYGLADAGGLCGDCKNRRGRNLLREVVATASSSGKSKSGLVSIPHQVFERICAHVERIDADVVAQKKINEEWARHKKQQEEDLAAGRAARLGKKGSHES
jgi:hypothetical protein